MKRTILLFLLFATILCTVALAHSGKTDGRGGHYNRSTGEYHYHHGHPAHQHPDGVCPYDFDDATDHSSGSNSQSGNIKTKPTATPKQTFAPLVLSGGATRSVPIRKSPKSNEESELSDALKKVGIGTGAVFVIYILPALISDLNKKRKHK